MINNEIIKLKLKIISSSSNILNNSLSRTKIKEKYNEWLNDLSQLMNNRLYRQTLKKIESEKYKFNSLKEELWKYRLIKAKAILKIIKIKMRKHLKGIILEKSKQNFSIKFWFNQIFLTLEELILEFRCDLNNQINYESKEVMEPIEIMIEYHFEFFYYLCIFYLKTKDIIKLIATLYLVEKFLIYIPFLYKPKILYYLEIIILIKIKILLQNCEYLAIFENIKILCKICFREMYLLFDYDTPINNNYFSNININHKKSQVKKVAEFCSIIQKIVLACYFGAVALEYLGKFKLSVLLYKNCFWFSNKFLYNYDKELFRFFKILRKKYIIFKEIFDDIHDLIKTRKNFEENKQIKENLFIKKYIINSSKSHKTHNSKKSKINRINSNISIFRNTKKIKNSPINLITKKSKLETLMKTLGNNLYKEEKNRNSSIFNKFTINSFVLSTVDMIDNLLSNQFSHVLKKMEKVEITNPQEEIKDLINKTINHKRIKEFKKELEKNKEKMKKIKHKKNYFNNSCDNIRIYKNNNFNLKIKLQKSKILEISKKEETENNNLKDEKNLFNIRMKSKINISKNIYKKINNNNISQNKIKKISKYPVNNCVFSRSFLSKRIFLDSFYEKELNFQKKLLKLKGNDIDKIPNIFNQQKAINLAEQEFKIIRNSTEDKSKKKHLINLIKNEKNFYRSNSMIFNKKSIERSNKKNSLKNIKHHIILNSINNSRVEYEPSNVSKCNEEKSKILNMECAELEQLQIKIRNQRKILMNKSSIINNNY